MTVLQSPTHNIRASVFLILASFLWSWLPFTMEVSNAKNNPILFFAVFGLCLALGLTLYLLIFQNFIFKNKYMSNLLCAIRNNKGVFIVLFLGRFGVALYAWSLEHITASVAAIIFESWVIIFVLIRNFDGIKNGSSNKRLRLGRRSIIIFMFAFAGFAFVNFSQTSEAIESLNWGVIIVIIAAILNAYSIERGLKFGELAAEGCSSMSNTKGQENITLAYTLLAVAITGFMASVINFFIIFVFSFLGGEQPFYFSSVSMPNVWLIIPFALVAAPIALTLLRLANIVTHSLEVNSLTYFTPVFAAIWIFQFTDSDVFRIDYYVIGTVMVIAANIILNIEVEGKNFGSLG